jgi:hypothetical protein
MFYPTPSCLGQESIPLSRMSMLYIPQPFSYLGSNINHHGVAVLVFK